jgi:hypothetical protein
MMSGSWPQGNAAKPKDRLGPLEQRVIGELLRVRYCEIVEGPVPDRLLELVAALDEADSSDPSGSGRSG